MIKDNRGFAITTVIYGTIILFILLLISALAIMSNYLKTVNLLMDSANGIRNIATMKHICVTETTIDQLKEKYVKHKTVAAEHEACRNTFVTGLYCLGSSSTTVCSNNCEYIPRKRVCN